MPKAPKTTMPSAGFVHLHVHSAYSLLKGSIKIAKLGELAKADRQPALALTDTDNMFGALEFSDKMAGYGIQPIIGCELAVDFGDQDPNARNALAASPARIVLLAARERGYRSLMRLNSRAFLETPVRTGRSRLPCSATTRASPLFAAIASRACSAIGSMSNCSATGSRRSAASRLA
jgi:DNA polymerase III alpha subunit